MLNRDRRSALSVGGCGCLVGCLLAIGSAPAQAQHALGDGQRLDRNFQQGSGGRNTPRAVTDFNLRNDLVTGNVAGGVQFRGDVGYTSPRAFRGFAGSDALFQFRADAALSALPAVLGGWTPDRFTLATDSAILYDRDTTVPALRSDHSGIPSAIDARALIQRSAAQGTMARAFERTADGLLVGGFRDGEGRQGAVIGSPLTGLRYEFLESGDVRSVDVGLYDWRRFENDRQVRPSPGTDRMTAGVDAPRLDSAGGLMERLGSSELRDPNTRLGGSAAAPSDLAVDLSNTAGAALSSSEDLAAASARLDVRRELGAASYDDLVRQLVDRYSQREGVRVSIGDVELQSALRTELDRLSAELRGSAPDYDRIFPGVLDPATSASRPGLASAAPGDDEARRAFRPGGLAGAMGSSGLRPGAASGAATPDADDAPGEAPAAPGDAPAASEDRPLRMSLEEMAALLRPRDTVRTLTPQQKSQADELVARGESQLREGEYFAAEQSFDRALRIAPGHPMASVGIIHANLGAGLYLSAAVQLRQLFVDQPAVVGLKYAPELLPPPARIERNMASIRELLSRSGADRNDYGLTLAYVAYQLGDVETVREGLDVIQGGDAETALRLLLKKVWLDE
jgi:hypothetical protein